MSSTQGGSREKREKSKRALLADGEKCCKLTDRFLKSSAASAASTNVSDTAEPAQQGKRQDSEEYEQEQEQKRTRGG